MPAPRRTVVVHICVWPDQTVTLVCAQHQTFLTELVFQVSFISISIKAPSGFVSAHF